MRSVIRLKVTKVDWKRGDFGSKFTVRGNNVAGFFLWDIFYC